jgi:hypothetical protein
MALGCASLTALSLAEQRLRRGVTFHHEPGGEPPRSGRQQAQDILDRHPATAAVGDDLRRARRASFRVIPGGAS